MRSVAERGFLDALASARYKKALRISTSGKLPKAFVNKMALKELESCISCKKFDWAMEISKTFAIAKEKRRRIAEGQYRQLMKSVRDGFDLSAWEAAEIALDYKLGSAKVRRAAEIAYDGVMARDYYKDAILIARKFKLGERRLKQAQSKPKPHESIMTGSKDNLRRKTSMGH